MLFLFILIIAVLFLILSVFYLMNSWQRYGNWAWPTFMVVVSLAVAIFAFFKLPMWNNGSTSSSASSSSQVSQQAASTSSSASFSSPNQGGLTGQTSQQSESTTQQNLLSQLKKNYSSIGGVTFDSGSKTYKILPTDSNTVKALNYIIKNPDQADQAGWSSFTKNLTKTSTQLQKVAGDGYSISIQEPGNDNTAMFSASDGKTTYNIVNN